MSPMDRGHADALMRWLYWCEAHPSRWASGSYEIPLHQVGMDAAQVDALFGRPDLASVRAAVETVTLAARGHLAITLRRRPEPRKPATPGETS